ncbi:hypothetical protein L227DRAFT_359230 [Lentinus tigrinus ALCF2SS1-6]|uniref:Uncharacterized protein n=1 Tax=Lentinus tigrinus ALCF2SS1-6 TaxID=1328759 RepID=A0A5C2SIU8_9APHY|nr:hypothetical protein L227DRAFT_359230 [Lentinus tigrinus ALCF2SS1-6]
MRASVAPNRQSQLPGSVSSAAAAAKLVEKKKEFEAVAALERASAQFLKRIEDLGDDFDVMADAGIVHGQVLEQWPNMFRILSLFCTRFSRVCAIQAHCILQYRSASNAQTTETRPRGLQANGSSVCLSRNSARQSPSLPDLTPPSNLCSNEQDCIDSVLLDDTIPHDFIEPRCILLQHRVWSGISLAQPLRRQLYKCPFCIEPLVLAVDADGCRYSHPPSS